MKRTRIVRKMDAMGRWVIPMEVRRIIDLKNNDSMELCIGDENEIVLKKYIPSVSAGIVRKIDNVGRWVIPMEVRRTLGLKEYDSLELFIGEENEVILKKYMPSINFLGKLEDLIEELQVVKNEKYELAEDEGGIVETIDLLKLAKNILEKEKF